PRARFPAPDWVAIKLQKRESAPVGQVPLVPEDLDANVQWFCDYLKTTAPESIEGKNGDDTILVRVFGVAKDRGISQWKTIELVDLLYNKPTADGGKCDPP